MTMRIHFLGTSCMVPTKDRNHISTALEYNGSIFLFDCGEGTQNQIKKMKLPIGKIKKIFISHWHGDHTIGLNGLIQTLSNTDNVERIEIHGPKDSKKYVEHTLKSSIVSKLAKIEVFEHNPKEGEILKVIDNLEYEILVSKLNHSVPCIAYCFKEKDTKNIDKKKAKELGIEGLSILSRAKMGLDIEHNGKKIKSKDITYTKKGTKICFVFDTRPCQEVDLLVKNADYLIMEATFIWETHKDKAEEYDHMSAKETAEIARINNVKTLLITHFSQRYKDIKDIENEAKEYFENTISAYDLMTYKIR
jgi:ribonuclease Z